MLIEGDREFRLAQALVALADGSDFSELFDNLIHLCGEIHDAEVVGLLLSDGDGPLRLVATSSHAEPILELFEPSEDISSPAVECFLEGAPIIVSDDEDQGGRWPALSRRLEGLGLSTVYALPMRRGDEVVGSLMMARADGAPLAARDLAVAQSMADTVTCSILHHRDRRADRDLVKRLQTAFNSRVIVERAAEDARQRTFALCR